MVFNKIDRVPSPIERKRLQIQFPDALFVSAFSDSDMRIVKEHIAEIVKNYKKESAMSSIIAKKTKELSSDPDAPQGLPWENE
jgi:50S ribosomal subunit-associated GTPase HflX